MDRLQAMQVFTRVVEASSFTKAADNLQLPRATVTNLVQSLEAHLGERFDRLAAASDSTPTRKELQ